MLRKEMKEQAQRALKGTYGKWAVIVLIPCLFIMIIQLTRVVTIAQPKDNWQNYLSDYNNYYSNPTDDWEDGYPSDEYGDEEDWYSDETIAYEYGYALGYKEGYVQGWNDGANNIGDGAYDYGHESDREFDQKIIDMVPNQPEDFVDNQDFEEGILFGFEYGYWYAWDYAIEWQTENNQLNYTNHSLTTYTNQPLTQSTEGTIPTSHYYVEKSFGYSIWIFFAGWLLLIIFRPFIAWAGVDTLDGEKVFYNRIFREIRKDWLRVYGANLKVTIQTFLWSLLLIVPGIIKYSEYSMTNYLLRREETLSAHQAIQLSRHLMKGYRLEYLIFCCSFYLWHLLTIVTFGVAGFYTIPYFSTTQTQFFDEIYYDKRTHIN